MPAAAPSPHLIVPTSSFLPEQVIVVVFVMLLSQDLPDGNYAVLRKSGKMTQKPGGWNVWKAALFNYRTWVMTLT